MRLNQLRETRINERGAALTKNRGNQNELGFLMLFYNMSDVEPQRNQVGCQVYESIIKPKQIITLCKYNEYLMPKILLLKYWRAFSWTAFYALTEAKVIATSYQISYNIIKDTHCHITSSLQQVNEKCVNICLSEIQVMEGVGMYEIQSREF